MSAITVTNWIRGLRSAEQSIVLAMAIQMAADLVFPLFEQVMPIGANTANFERLRTTYERLVGHAYAQPINTPQYRVRPFVDMIMEAELLGESFFKPFLPKEETIWVEVEDWKPYLPGHTFDRKDFLKAGMSFASALEQIRMITTTSAENRPDVVTRIVLSGVTAAVEAWLAINSRCVDDRHECINRFYDKLQRVSEVKLAEREIRVAIDQANKRTGIPPEVVVTIETLPLKNGHWAYIASMKVTLADDHVVEKRVKGKTRPTTGQGEVVLTAAEIVMKEMKAPVMLLVQLPQDLSAQDLAIAKDGIDEIAARYPMITEVDFLRGLPVEEQATERNTLRRILARQ